MPVLSQLRFRVEYQILLRKCEPTPTAAKEVHKRDEL